MPDPVTGFTVGATVLSSNRSANAAESAANSQVASADRAALLQKQSADQQIELNKPFRENGLAGQNRLMDLLGLSGNAGAQGYGSATKNFTSADFETDPGYQWRTQQGQQGLERSAAAKGGLLSGGAMKDAMDYNQGAASQEYGNAFNRFQTNRANLLNPLQSLAGQAQTATGQMNNAIQNYGNNASNLATQAGNAQASGYVGSANAFNGGVSQGINNFLDSRLMNKMFPQTSSQAPSVYDNGYSNGTGSAYGGSRAGL